MSGDGGKDDPRKGIPTKSEVRHGPSESKTANKKSPSDHGGRKATPPAAPRKKA